MFISGVGGTGKSFLIHTIRAMVNELWKDNKDSVRCALAAPTGQAVFNIDGVTVHRLFRLPIEHDSKTSNYWPLPKESLKMMRNGFKHLKLIIIDEVSMLYLFQHAPLTTRGDPRNIAIIGHWDEWHPFSASSKHSCGTYKHCLHINVHSSTNAICLT